MSVVVCPDWPVVAAGYDDDVPVAVIGARAAPQSGGLSHNAVVACSEAAREAGVKPGLRRRQAESRCPRLVVIDNDPGRDARAFEPVVAAIESFTPRVEVFRPGVCAFATRGPSRYFGGDDLLAVKVAEKVDRVLTQTASCRVGIADGRFAAELAAVHGVRVRRGASAGFLAPLPVDTLDEPDLVHLLRRLGIRTLGDLAALSAAAVLARFGPAGRRAHRRARGLDDVPLSARIPPVDFSVSAELDPPVVQLETAAFAAKSLADQLADRLAGQGLALTGVRIEAETEHGEHLARLWHHDRGLTAAALAQRVRWQLDGWFGSTASNLAPTGGLILLRLVPEKVGPDRGHQAGFWGSGGAGDERAARALARVQAALGHEAVVTGVVQGGRGPAEQIRLVPWGDPRPADDAEAPRARAAPQSGAPRARAAPQSGAPRARAAPQSGAPRARAAPQSGAPWPGAVPPPAPATIHFPPVEAEVVDASGRQVMVTGRGQPTAEPSRLRVGGGSWVGIDGWAGPWPVDERWWDRASHRRRARWQVATASGAAHLLTVEGGRWWVDATYD